VYAPGLASLFKPTNSLISATDPVSTLVLFAELRVEPHLFYLVFGESVMNDAVGLVLFDTAREFITKPGLQSSDLIKVRRV
jgi:NhaP-type Na+/H+ or K+/H+ antiporter